MSEYIYFSLENQTTYGMISFRIEGGVASASDAEAVDLVERIRDSDLVTRLLPGGTVAINSLTIGGLSRQPSLS